MKLWYSFIKELKLTSKTFYFYIEIIMALMILAVLLFIVPEKFTSKEIDYISINLPSIVKNNIINELLSQDLDKKVEKIEFKLNGKKVYADLYESKESKVYLFEDKETMIEMAKEKKPLVGINFIWDEERKKVDYEYYLQGYETKRLRNLFLLINSKNSKDIEKTFNNIKVKKISDKYQILNDKENMLPPFLALNGSFMALFILAALIFLDKQEGIIKAYAVTASKVWHYLMSKVLVILLITTITSLVIVIPIMKAKVSYLMLIFLLVTSGFFASSLGLLIASFYKNLMNSFSAMYFIVMLLILPNISYFIPSWQPKWIKFIPTYPLIQGIKETLIKNGDMNYTFIVSIGFLLAGVFTFIFSNYRYKKTLVA